MKPNSENGSHEGYNEVRNSMTTCTFGPENVWHFQVQTPDIILPNFVLSVISHTFCRCLPNAHKKGFPDFLLYVVPTQTHTHTQKSYSVFIKTKSTMNTHRILHTYN